MTQSTNIQITIIIQDPELDDEELQAGVEKLLPQVREVDGVERAELVNLEHPPRGSKAFSGFLLGMLTAEVNPANLKRFMAFLGERLAGKQIELQVKTPDGRELNIKASSQAEFEFAFQKAQEFTKS
ncbi:MAG: sugar ABC transporter permease [Gammaproteobacteria bacterium]